jgi:predicted TIM-barrel fold metal-dependent hydrolase
MFLKNFGRNLDRMIIDCHTHINNYHSEATASLDRCLSDLQTEMRRNRVDTALILTSFKITLGRPSTRDAVRATRDLKNIRIVAGISYLHHTRDDIVELRDYIIDGSVCGLKLYPGYEPFYPNDPKLVPAYELAEEFSIPVMIHSGDTYSPSGKIKYSHPIHIDEVAVDHPGVNFVICHLGNPWLRDCMEVVYKNRNVYTDISGLVLGDFTDRFEQYMRKQLQEMLIYGVEPEKVLYGSDWPISSMASYLQFMEELSIPPADKRKIMYENSARLFKLPVATSAERASLLSWLR